MRTPPQPVAIVPAAPLLLPGIALGVISILGISKNRSEREKFLSMTWFDPPEDDDADGCVLIGEEAAPDGKQWFVCSEPSGADMECEKVDNYGSPKLVDRDTSDYLCKQPKVNPA